MSVESSLCARRRARLAPIARRVWRLPLLALLGAATGAHADCIDDAARRHQVHAGVLRAIGWQESRLQTAAVHRNTDGSIDHGAFQINSVHLPLLARYGLDAGSLLDGCTAADVAAWHYRQQVEHFGNTWAAVGAYHSRTPARAAWYADRIAEILMSWTLLPAGPLPYGTSRKPPAAAGAATAPFPELR